MNDIDTSTTAAPRPLRVLHVIPSLSPRRGGPTDAILGLCPELEKLGVETTIITTDDDVDARLDVPLMQPVMHEGCRVIFFPRRDGWTRLLRDFSYSPGLRRWLQQHIGEFDLLHVHALFSYAPSRAMQIAPHEGVPYICRPLGLLGEWALRQKPLRKRAFIKMFDAENLRQAAAIEYSSQEEFDEARSLRMETKAEIIPLGFCLVPEVPDARARFCQQNRIDPSRFLILFFSRVHAKKGLDLLVQACAALPKERIHLIIAGSGDPAFEKSIRLLVQRLGLEGQTTWTGFLKGSAKHEVLRGADVFVLPSHSESFGIAVAEAMSAGCDIIVSRMVPMSDWVRRAEAGWVIDPTAEAVTQALQEALEQRAQHPQRAQRAIAAALDITYAATARMVLRVYERSLRVDAESVGAGQLLRVLHVIPSLSPTQGGPSYALPLMARTLSQHGLHIDVLTTDDDGRGCRQERELGVFEEREGWRVIYFAKQTEFYKLSLPLWRWLRQNVRAYDVIHIHAIFSFSSIAAMSVAREYGVPYIIRPLGVLNAWGMTQRRRLAKSLSFALLDRPLINAAAAMHYTSVQERDEASRLALAPASEVIPLGVDLAVFDTLAAPSVFLDTFPQVASRRYVLFLSRVDVKKGIELLLRAWAMARPAWSGSVCLVIAGTGTSDYVQRLHDLAASLDISDDVIWTGHLQGKVKLAAFAAAALFVLPSQSENFGIALLEAMAAGCACLSTPEVALAKDVEHRHAVEIVPAEAAAWASALQRLLASPAEAQALAHRAHEVARDTFSLAAMGISLQQLYRKLARHAA